MNKPNYYDIAIIGAGLVGSSLAYALADLDLSVILFDKTPINNTLYHKDNRGLALSYVSKQIISKFGLWEKLKTQAHIINTVHVSTQGKFGFAKFSSKKVNIPALGYTISARILESILVKNLPANIKSLRPIHIKDFCYNNLRSNWTIVTEKEKFTSKIIVGADGTNSIVRSMAGIMIRKHANTHTSIVSNIKTQIDNTIAYERFTELGILALLPFGSKNYKCILTIANNKLPELMNLNQKKFIEKIQNMFGYRLGKIIDMSERKIFPIQEIKAKTLTTASGVVLLGNAANTIHPIAAQGFNLGLRDALMLSELLCKNDCHKAIAMYSKYRLSDHIKTRNFTDYLISMPNKIRTIGILISQFMPILNHMLTRRGLGSWI